MEAVVEGLVDDVRQLASHAGGDKGGRILVGICGIPGSGKSQLARHVVDRLNANSATRQAVVVGMDGWHLTRAQLAAMPDPDEAKARRGAPWTFDDEAFAKFIQRLRASSCNEEICAPSFSHAKKDPVPGDVKVLPGDRFVFIEGLYANVNEGAWALAAKSYDARWLIQCDEQVATQRLKQRHVDTGVASTVEEAVWRINNNDLPNGRYLLSHITEPTKRIHTADDVTWRGGG